jgi:hypothetical protein
VDQKYSGKSLLTNILDELRQNSIKC